MAMAGLGSHLLKLFNGENFGKLVLEVAKD
jgi:NADPH-dependent curcumin reductase CurA